MIEDSFEVEVSLTRAASGQICKPNHLYKDVPIFQLHKYVTSHAHNVNVNVLFLGIQMCFSFVAQTVKTFSFAFICFIHLIHFISLTWFTV